MSVSQPAGSPEEPQQSVDGRSRRSLSFVVRRNLLAKILGGTFEDNHLPPESELAAQMGVSRTTIRSALQVLERDGLITRRRGAGTFVRPSPLPYGLGLHRLVGFSDLLAERGYKPGVTQEVTSTNRLKRDWIERLALRETETCLILKKLFKAEEIPALAIVDVVPYSFLEHKPPEEEPVPDAIFTFFERHGRQPVDHASVEIVPKAASSTIAKRLGIRHGQPYLHLVETHYNRDNVPMALSYIDVNDRHIRFHVTRQHG